MNVTSGSNLLIPRSESVRIASRSGYRDPSKTPSRVSGAGPFLEDPRKSHLQRSLALPRVDDDPGFFKIGKYAPHFIGHAFRVYSDADLDERIQQVICEVICEAMKSAG